MNGKERARRVAIILIIVFIWAVAWAGGGLVVGQSSGTLEPRVWLPVVRCGSGAMPTARPTPGPGTPTATIRPTPTPAPAMGVSNG